MSKAIRARIVDDFTSRFRGQASVIVVGYAGLTSAQASQLRLDLRQDRIRVTVVKNSSARRAFDGLGWSGAGSLLAGPTAIVHGVDDPVLLSKRLVAWRDKHKVLEIRGGCVDGKALTADGIKRLSQMPSREVILANVVGAVAAPLSSFAGTLEAVLRQFAATVKALQEKRGQEGGAAAPA